MFDSRFASLLRRLSALALCILLLPPSAPARAAFPKPLTVSFTVVTYQNCARSALKQINSLRKEDGLAPLVMPAELEKAAIQRAAELFVFFDHDRPDLSAYDTVDDAYACGQTSLAVAECIAAGYSNADKLMDDWRENALDTLLDGDFTHAGLACVYVKGSYNEYYWALYLQQQPVGFSAREADAAAKAGKSHSVKVAVGKDMYGRADNSHKRFELRAGNLSLKTKQSAVASVYLYDRYGVKIGKLAPEGLTFQSSNTKVFSVLQSGTVKRKGAGTATLTVSAPGLDDIKCTVTTGGPAGSSQSSGNNTAATAATIGDRKPMLSATPYAKHTSLSVYVKGASGYVLYRATSKTGRYAKVDEQATTKRWTLKLEHEDLSRAYYYKVRAYKNSGGKRMYSEYCTPVRVSP